MTPDKSITESRVIPALDHEISTNIVGLTALTPFRALCYYQELSGMSAHSESTRKVTALSRSNVILSKDTCLLV